MRTATPASLAIALPLALCAAGAAAEISSHALDNGVIRAVATEAIGGRLVSFGLAGKPNFLKFDPTAGNPADPVTARTPNVGYLGHEIWLGPQSQWWAHQSVNAELAKAKSPWPPDPFLSVAPYRLSKQSKDEVVVESAASPVSGIALTKRFALAPGKPNSLQVEVSAVNRRDKAVAWDIWFNTRTHAEARVYVPVDPSVPVRTQQIATMTSGPLKYIVKDGVFSLDMPVKPALGEPARHGKVFIQPSHGWMAGFHSGQAFIVQFPLQPRAAIHPEQGQVEIFNDWQPADPAKGLMEMEVHAPYRTLAPGEKMQASELWTILPYDGATSREAHLAFLRAQAARLGLKGL